MDVRIFISHSAEDDALGGQLVELLATMIAGAQVGGSSLPGHVPDGGTDSLAALKQALSDSDVVVGLITARAMASGEVPFQLGAAWVLGKRILLLLDPNDSTAELYLPMGYADALVLGPEALLELASSIASHTGARLETGAAARDAVARLFPDWQGPERQSTERPVEESTRDSISTQQLWPVDPDKAEATLAQAPVSTNGHGNGAQRPSLPSCSASLQAGRAVSDCVFNRDEGGNFAAELDLPFGAFLAALGGNWSVLRDLQDLDVWLEAAENVLGALTPSEQHVRYWYEVGYQLATLFNLAGREVDGGSPQAAEIDAAWETAARQFRDAVQGAEVPAASLAELEGLLDNIGGPEQARDYAMLARMQERVRELAGSYDLGDVAQSA